MSVIVSNTQVKQAERDRLHAQYEEYIAQGNEVEQVPRGVSGIKDNRVNNGHVVYSEEHMAKNKYRGPGIRIGEDK